MTSSQPTAPFSLTKHLLSLEPEVFTAATQHPFLLAAAKGTLSKDVLSHWLVNDRLYIHAYIRAAGQLLASLELPKHLPGEQAGSGKEEEDAFEVRLVDWLIEALGAVRREEKMFLEVGGRYQLVDFVGVSSTTAKRAVAKVKGLEVIEGLFGEVGMVKGEKKGGGLGSWFLGAAAAGGGGGDLPVSVKIPWLEGAVTFWGTEKVYLEAWSWAREQQEERPNGIEDEDGGALRKEFIPNWSSDEFREFVEKLGVLIDQAVEREIGMAGEDGQKQEEVKKEILGRVEGKWRTLLEGEKGFWPDL
ncbi:hypothetical protein QBC40DRAFT_231733 [Triangularia verruculosa]|uniref:Thiaminase-2/PQQC domain-containing protein n=1 Tax=Triangularia verruculosa TaxID=2587418 RepID=A0AAN6XC99_9PEZI|nr:hypothetical protein QBC40DRAFT_231733 [Triangularia verruculosa]